MTYWRLFYCITFAVKDREPLIISTIEPKLHRTMIDRAVELGGIVHAVGGTEDHVHMAISTSPKILLADFIHKVKGSSSHFVNRVLRLDLSFAWQDEHGIVSFSEKQLPVVVAYLQNQRAHHKENTLFAGLENSGQEPSKGSKSAEDCPTYEWNAGMDSPF